MTKIRVRGIGDYESALTRFYLMLFNAMKLKVASNCVIYNHDSSWPQMKALTPSPCIRPTVKTTLITKA